MTAEQDILDELQRMRDDFKRLEREVQELREQVAQETVTRRQAVAHVRDSRGMPRWIS